jgi:hypothetical protein
VEFVVSATGSGVGVAVVAAWVERRVKRSQEQRERETAEAVPCFGLRRCTSLKRGVNDNERRFEGLAGDRPSGEFGFIRGVAFRVF